MEVRRRWSIPPFEITGLTVGSKLAARLRDTNLMESDLRDVDLRDADLRGARIDLDTAVRFAAAHGLVVS